MKKFQNAHPRRLIKLIMLCSVLLAIPLQSYARDVSFTWAANSGTVTGYKLYYKAGSDNALPYQGTGLNEGSSPIVLGKVTTCIVTGLLPNETYHFVLTAYNATEESGYSVIASVPPISSPRPTILNIFIKN